jgi:hypothetical protein
MPNLYVALIHYPVVNKSGDVITSAITNLDLHDLSRATKTYGAKAFYVVTPLKDQITLANRIIDHWTRGAGAHYNQPLPKSQTIYIAGNIAILKRL